MVFILEHESLTPDCKTPVKPIDYKSCFSAFIPLIFGMLIGVLLILFEFLFKCCDKNHEKEKSKKNLNELRKILENHNAAISILKQEIQLRETQIKTQDLNSTEDM